MSHYALHYTACTGNYHQVRTCIDRAQNWFTDAYVTTFVRHILKASVHICVTGTARYIANSRPNAVSVPMTTTNVSLEIRQTRQQVNIKEHNSMWARAML